MRRLLLIVALVLLPTQVLAECAWIEWVRSGMGETLEEWEPHRSFESLAECNNHTEKRFRYLASQPKAYRTGDMVTWVYGDILMGEVIRCLPDTVDPRGK